MSQRNYNIYYHLHTISGIAISVALFVIFFAGAFTLFVGPIEEWEQSNSHQTVSGTVNHDKIDYNRLIDSLSNKGYDLYARDISVAEEGKKLQIVRLGGSEDTAATENQKKPITLELNTDTYELKEINHAYSLGDFFYQLHYFDQLGRFGYYLSGAIAFVFFFAMITGIIVHWKKVKMNFNLFRPGAKPKTMWTDMHTMLGVIGIPFQFIYALTGAMFGLGILIGLSGSLSYKGDVEKVYDVMYDRHEHEQLGSKTDVSNINYNEVRNKVENYWPGFKGKYISIHHFGTSTQQLSAYGYLDATAYFLNDGEIVLDMATGKSVHEHNPYQKKYVENIWAPVYRLHFANYGDIGKLPDFLLKMVYFIMALLTCLVIISGVMIWLEARKKLNISDQKKRANKQVGHIFIAICMSMLPVSAAAFIVSKLLPSTVDKELALNCFYLISWLVLSLFFWWKQNNAFTNRWTLLSAGYLGLGVIVTNGFSSGNWMWTTLSYHNFDVLIMDFLWLILSICCLYACFKLKKSPYYLATMEQKKDRIANKTL